MNPPTHSAAARPYFWPALLLAAYLLFWLVLAIAPANRQDWLLENGVVAIALPFFVFTARRLRFSTFSYVALFFFLSAHAIGAHYTYSDVPYDDAFRALSGHGINELLGLQRNHYDRFVHFLFGFLLVPLAAELFAARAPPRGVWRWLMPVLFIEGCSALYELIEWLAAVVFGGELGQAYLGTQGDIWDAQWDMLLALIGAALMQTLLMLRRRA